MKNLISRQAVINTLYEMDKVLNEDRTVDMYRDLLKECYTVLPSVNPQEPVLDKIRAEILEEKECAYADFEQYKVEYLGVDAEYAEDELPDDDFRYGMERAIEIIDKYKAERINK